MTKTCTTVAWHRFAYPGVIVIMTLVINLDGVFVRSATSSNSLNLGHWDLFSNGGNELKNIKKCEAFSN
jgi:hypothetical protein